MTAAPTNITQAWLDKAVALRADMLKSEVVFFDFLIEGEKGGCPWRGQYTSFEQFLAATNLVAPSRYVAYRDALARAHAEVREDADTLGVDGVIEAGRMPQPARVTFVNRVVKGARDQGCPLSVRRVKQIGREVSPPDDKPQRVPGEPHDVKKLLVENKTLRAENEALRKRVQYLEKENGALRAKSKK